MKSITNLQRGWPSFLFALLSSGLIGILLWGAPLGQRLEMHFGLELAFLLRGERPASPETVYIPISHTSADVLGQESIYDLDEWDRSLFAQLVDRLSNKGASVIVFDVLFVKGHGDRDSAFLKAIADADNVVLLSWVEQSRQMGSTHSEILLNIDQLLQPAPVFAEAARATAPMLLRKDIRMDRFDTFPRVASQIIPAIPTVALYLHLNREAEDLVTQCLTTQGAEAQLGGVNKGRSRLLTDSILALRAALRNRIGMGEGDLRVEACDTLRASVLGEALSRDSERYFNFYGQRGTLAGPGLHELLGPEADRLAEGLKGKVVFIGIADNDAVNPPDSFDVAPSSSGMSGVELAATAFANLLHGEDLRQIKPAQGALLLLLFGAAIGVIFYVLPVKPALIVTLLCAAIYAVGAGYLFIHDQLWLPIIVPLFVQVPVTVALGWRSRLLEFERLTDTLKKFLSKWLRGKISRHEPISTEPELLYGVCLHTDVAGYTVLSERLSSDPLLLKSLEKEYWSMVDEQIDAENGERLEISGDGMMCIWTAPKENKEVVAHACRAALKLQFAIDRFNQRHVDTPFHTRIGLHAGKVALGLIGGAAQYTLAVGGDIANTAARLESDINKLLHTRLLGSGVVALKFDFARTRKVGTFVLRGKTKEIAVYEILDKRNAWPIDPGRFDAALVEFESGNWEDAKRLFQQLCADYPDDGPSRFYRRLLDTYGAGLHGPPAGKRREVIDLNEKWVLAEIAD
ncbi:MAG: adenylate/guanylate cyclase domain-containing protein [Sedimenticolaceae bacterium]